MEEIFKTIFTACKALSWLKQISADEGQLESIDESGNPKPVALLPCLLIDAQETRWEAGDLINQYGDATIVTRFACRKIADQSNVTKDATFEASIVSLKKRVTVEKAIAQAINVNHGRLIRLSTDREKRSDGIIVYRTTWGCSVSELL
ncbi:MAG: hypothetical protein NTX38_00205 [Methylobacter sp.]|nr:hypothetical protein [Methylobacter sp.]